MNELGDDLGQDTQTKKKLYIAVGLLAGGLLAISLVILVTNSNDGSLAPIFALVALALSVPLILYIRSWNLPKRYNETREFDVSRLEFFKSRLETVSLGLGQKSPELVVVDAASPNSFVMRRHNTMIIGVSTALLVLVLTDHETEAVMSDMLARVVLSEAATNTQKAPDKSNLIPVVEDIVNRVHGARGRSCTVSSY